MFPYKSKCHEEIETLLEQLAHAFSVKTGESWKAWKTLLTLQLAMEIIKGSSLCLRWPRKKIAFERIPAAELDWNLCVRTQIIGIRTWNFRTRDHSMFYSLRFPKF